MCPKCEGDKVENAVFSQKKSKNLLPGEKIGANTYLPRYCTNPSIETSQMTCSTARDPPFVPFSHYGRHSNFPVSVSDFKYYVFLQKKTKKNGCAHKPQRDESIKYERAGKLVSFAMYASITLTPAPPFDCARPWLCRSRPPCAPWKNLAGAKK